MSATPRTDYVAETLRQALAVADQQANQAALRLANARREVEQCEQALADANARRDALTHELRLRQAAPETGPQAREDGAVLGCVLCRSHPGAPHALDCPNLPPGQTALLVRMPEQPGREPLALDKPRTDADDRRH